MKKAYYIPIIVVLILFFTNPSLKDFKEHTGINTAQLESQLFPQRTRNYFLCSIYNFGGSEGTYFAVLGNFFYFKGEKQKSEEYLKTIYDRLSQKMELGNFEDFKEQLKDKTYRASIYVHAEMFMGLDDHQEFEERVKLATN